MKSLLILVSLILVGCNGATGTGSLASADNGNSTSSPPTSNLWNGNRVDNTVQSISYDNLGGSGTYFTSSNYLNDSDVFTIPEYINIDADSNNTIQSDDYVELQIANRTTCRYNKVTNYFQFQSCQTVLSSITWTIQANDIYRMSDLNNGAPVAYKTHLLFVLKSNTNSTMNGTIQFSYDL